VENQRSVTFTFFVGAVLAGVFARQVCAAVAQAARVELPSVAGLLDASGVAGLVVGVVSFFVGMRHEVATAFVDSVWTELGEVAWPSRDETSRNTSVVLGASILFSVVLFVYDAAWMRLLALAGFTAG
jgi:preprotein translocase SecE subunit